MTVLPRSGEEAQSKSARVVKGEKQVAFRVKYFTRQAIRVRTLMYRCQADEFRNFRTSNWRESGHQQEVLANCAPNLTKPGRGSSVF